MSEESKNAIVLVVEDDFVDIEAVRRGIGKRDLDYDLHVKGDGQQALDFLRGELEPGDREQLIVFLDINMPGMNGHQFLDALRADEKLRRIIVFVLTTSDHEIDKSKAYDRNVAGYFVKSNIDGLLDTVAVYTDNVEFPPASV
ncbi:MAG: response regulator [Planctomycetota bacterium]